MEGQIAEKKYQKTSRVMKHEKEEVSGETLRAKGGFNQSREAEEKDG